MFVIVPFLAQIRSWMHVALFKCSKSSLGNLDRLLNVVFDSEFTYLTGYLYYAPRKIAMISYSLFNNVSKS